MTVATADREVDTVDWNDSRLDEFSKRVDERFNKVDKRFDQLDRKVDAGFARLDTKIDNGLACIDTKIAGIDDKFVALGGRLDGFYQVLVQATVAVSVGILGLLGVLIGIARL